jgi:hypothetical protein
LSIFIAVAISASLRERGCRPLVRANSRHATGG